MRSIFLTALCLVALLKTGQAQSLYDSTIDDEANDGKGFDRNLIRSGNGLRNMEQRATAINATFNIFSAPGKGTSINMDIPVA